MADERTRSEYRFQISSGAYPEVPVEFINLVDDDRAGLAQLMLDAYQGTVDDEGESFQDALDAIDIYLQRCLRPHSFVLKQGPTPIAMSLALVVDDVHYIDPVAVSAGYKRAGLGRQMVVASLASLAATGVREVGATITDGNVPSEKLFARLGASRVGPWPPNAPAS